MFRKMFFVILLSILFVPAFLTITVAGGIPLQKDVYLGAPIFGAEDLPESLSFVLYDSKSATSTIGSQTFARGEYDVDFEFSKSDGITSNSVARINAEFTNKLNINSDPESAATTKEIWLALEVEGSEVGERTIVSDDTLVQLLLASDASIATYLTLVYEGDDNPIATIYRDLPISSSGSSDTALADYFSALPGVSTTNADTRGAWVSGAGDNVYVNGSVGIWTATPGNALDVNGNISVNDSIMNPGDTQKVTIYSSKTPNKGAKLEFWAAGNATYPGHIYLDYGDYTAAINPACKFNIRAMNNGTVVNAIVANASGNVGIRTIPNDTYTLAVAGKIGCQELTVTSTGWADFVFEESYKLPLLNEVEAYITANKHLPGIPSAAEVKEKGVSVGDMSSKLLQKIEELTLYVIDLKKENEAIKVQLDAMQTN